MHPSRESAIHHTFTNARLALRVWRDAVYQAASQDVRALSYATEAFNDPVVALDAVTDDGDLLRYCNLRLRSR